MGKSAVGCQLLSARRTATDAPQAATPPSPESTTASVSNCRTSLVRPAPTATRIANSRARSAVRAANSPPRLAQAASSTSPASNITPSKNDWTGPRSASPRKPGCVSSKARLLSVFGYSLASSRAIAFRLAVAAAMDTPLFSRPTMNKSCSPRSLIQSYPSICAWFMTGTNTSG